MAEETTTPYKALEESMTNLSKDLMDLRVTLQQHSEGFVKYNTTLEWILKSLEAIFQSVARIERQLGSSSQPPSLPTPASPDTTARTDTLMAVPPRLPKVQIPCFSGENGTSWLFVMGRVFEYHKIPDEQKLMIATFYMSSPALQWFQWMNATAQLSTWEEFACQLETRFGPSPFNRAAALFKISQTATVNEYLHEFECLSNRTTGLSLTNLLNCFIAGLKEEIQEELYMLRPSSFAEAVRMARLIEKKLY